MTEAGYARVRQSRLTLSFADRSLEREYVIDRARRSVPQLRVGVTVLVIVSSLFGFAFYGLSRGRPIEGLGTMPEAAVVGTAISLVTFVGFVIAIGQPRVWPRLQELTVAAALVWFGVDIPTLGGVSVPYSVVVTLSALIVVYGILRLRFVYAAILGSTVVVAHLSVVAISHSLDDATQTQLAFNALLAVMMNVILMVTAYQLEASDRAAFGHHRETEQREAKLRALVDELTEAESRLLEAEREAAQSRLVAGLLHELNNPNAVLRSNLQLWDRLRERLQATDARRDPEAFQRVAEHLEPAGEAISASGRRVTDALRRLETFVGLDAGEKVSVDVGDGVRDAAQMVHAQRGTHFEVSTPAEPVRLHAHRYRLNQVWLHLLDNAAKAVGPEGRVRVEVTVEGGATKVEIEDNGPGMDDAALSEAFRVGFSDGGGRVRFHLGLPLSRRVVEEHGGEIALRSTPGVGTVAEVRLPLA